ncbi:MAG TPA: DUF6691 family protein [Dongiaceae bacterium]|nr:DUF6691 family protein [Dongiaceae bacterium]
MKNVFSAFIVGLIFGIGLLVSGMSNPQKVLGFLDLAGNWDPSLALVMVGAIGVAAIGFALARRRSQTLLNEPMPPLPAANSPVDRRLVIGSVLFGIGWGIAGFCPGPVLVALGLAFWPAVPVLIAMLAGFWVGVRRY